MMRRSTLLGPGISMAFAAALVAAPYACRGDRPAEGGAKDIAADGSAATRSAAIRGAPAPAHHLFAWAGDLDRRDTDFLAVIDADPQSPGYGEVVASVPAGVSGTHPHHTEHAMPENGHLFANGFMAGRTFRFELSDPRSPRLLGSFAGVAEFTYPHSYVRLPNGNVLATFQGRGASNVDPGGLVEITDAGAAVRAGSAADPRARQALIRPYSLAVLPGIDRVVTTSYDMGEDMGFTGGRRGRTRVVQVWRLSDLSVIATIDLPSGSRGRGTREGTAEGDRGRGEQPGEPRVLEDGRTVLVATFACGLYRMTGLDGPDPGAEFVHGFEGGGCAVPVVAGDFWIQSVPSAHAIVTLDVADPSEPREVSRVTLGSRNYPHWLALDPGGRRLVVADRGDGERRLFVLTFDPDTGDLAVDEGFRDRGSDRPGVTFDRQDWPHGATGSARPHGTVFGF